MDTENTESFKLSIKTAYIIPISTNITFLESSGKDLSISTYMGLISGVILTLHSQVGSINPIRCGLIHPPLSSNIQEPRPIRVQLYPIP